MKKTLFLAVAAVTALFSACSCDELATNGAADGNMVNVTFSADLDQALVTRGVAGESDGTAATKLYVAVYNKDKQLIEAISHIGTTNSQAIETVSGKAATVNFQLVKGQTYSFVFWAQNPNATTGAVVFDPTTGKVNVDYSKIKANDETLDAFTAHVNDLTVTGALSQSVTLKRPWAQVNYGSAQADWDAAVAAGITVAKSKVTVNNVYTTLNALNGEVEGDATTADVVLAANTIPAKAATPRTLTVSGTNYKYLGLNYLLVGNEGQQSLIKADLQIFKEGDDNTPVNTLAFSNVPVQRNYRTNIIGNLLTSQTQFSITLDEMYEGDRNIDAAPKPAVNVANADELITALSDGSGFKQYGIVKLTEDIDMTGKTARFSLNGYNGSFKNLTLDGDGHKITGLTTPLFSGTWAGDTQLAIQNLTIEGANIVETSADHPGTGVFICGISATKSVLFDNCHIKNCNLTTSHYGGGFFTYADGYNNPNDGPVFQTVIIRNSSVEGCTFKAKKSVGAICGHATGNAWTKIQVENTVVKDNTIINTNNRKDNVGAVLGTVGVAGTESNGLTGGTYLVNLTVTGNTVKYTDGSSNEVELGNNHWVGRVGSNGGKLWIDDVLRAKMENNAEVFYKADGYTVSDVDHFIE